MKYICGPEWDERIVNLNVSDDVAILTSGGMDSYVLLKMLEKHTKNITCYVAARKDNISNKEAVEKIIDRPVTIIEETKDQPHYNKIEVAVRKVYPNHKQTYIGVNMVPPVDHFGRFEEPNKPYRPWRIDDPRKKLFAPFLHLYKYHILDLAIRNEIDPSHTISCLTYPDKHCGNCWQCLERSWAYDQLGMKSPINTVYE